MTLTKFIYIPTKFNDFVALWSATLRQDDATFEPFHYGRKSRFPRFTIGLVVVQIVLFSMNQLMTNESFSGNEFLLEVDLKQQENKQLIGNISDVAGASGELTSHNACLDFTKKPKYTSSLHNHSTVFNYFFHQKSCKHQVYRYFTSFLIETDSLKFFLHMFIILNIGFRYSYSGFYDSFPVSMTHFRFQ